MWCVPKQRKLNGVYKSHIQELFIPTRSIIWKNREVQCVSLSLTLLLPSTTSACLHPPPTFWAWLLYTIPDLKHQLLRHAPQGHSPISGAPRRPPQVWQCCLRYAPLYFLTSLRQLRVHFLFLIHSLWWSSGLPKVTTETWINLTIWKR